VCGIVGYIGDKDVDSVILVGLERLEYRGYDSCGIAAIKNGEIKIKKVVGRLQKLKKALAEKPLSGERAIGHTRWATHGRVTEKNAHPFLDCTNTLAIVHNGIIENYREIKKRLVAQGHKFVSDTDTEVIVHLIESYYQDSLPQALAKAVKELKGSYAIVALSTKEPYLVGCRMGSPLVVGLGRGENILASDTLALLGIARKVMIIEDQELCIVTKDRVKILNFDLHEVKRSARTLELKPKAISKGRHPHYMRKEIFEQPAIIAANITRRLSGNRLLLDPHFHFYPDELAKVSRIVIQACGTSYHAGLVGRHYLQDVSQVTTQVELASEFHTRDLVLDGKPLILAISQSGETADTLTALREAQTHGLKILSVLNVKRSSMDRESDGVLYINAGPEIGVASTKAYTAQIFTLLIFSLYLARARGVLADNRLTEMATELKGLPKKLEKTLELDRFLKKIAEQVYKARHFLFLGRGINYPSALEGALKLKEVSYIPSIGYPAGEMKHGPISLIDKNVPVVCIATRDSVYEKMLSNIEEVKARGGKVVAIGTEGDESLKELAWQVIYIPKSIESLVPLLAAVPLQLLAYHIALFRGCDVDKPRNLAKSVTVE
jgi:glucosamine--fructose-6-phosphate aminotransferase (isomerizing)